MYRVIPEAWDSLTEVFVILGSVIPRFYCTVVQYYIMSHIIVNWKGIQLYKFTNYNERQTLSIPGSRS